MVNLQVTKATIEVSINGNGKAEITTVIVDRKGNRFTYHNDVRQASVQRMLSTFVSNKWSV